MPIAHSPTPDARTSHGGTQIPKMGRELSGPTPLLLPLPLPTFPHDPHPPPDLTLHRPHPTTLLALGLALDVLRDDKGLALDAPLRHRVLDPKRGLDGPAAAAALGLRALAVPGRGGEDVGDFLHADVGGEGGEVGFVEAGVRGCGVVRVGGQLGPHAAEDAVADAREVRGG